MIDRFDRGNRAVILHPVFPGTGPEALDEFRELARSAGVEVPAELTAPRGKPDARFFVGQGKVEELREAVAEHDADLVLVSRPLSPVQERNIEKQVRCRVLDRTTLILDIFAQRARSHEGKLQVELAQLRHLSTRLVRGWTHLERQKGGIGLRGPGETQLETDRRLIGQRIRHLRDRLVKVNRQRAQGQRRRRRGEALTVALVGYTNAGKSTLFNALTDAGVDTRDMQFATLDPTVRRLAGTQEELLLADTVGFVSELPHELIAAFRATLLEARQADLLLHVIDAADPFHSERRDEVLAVLEAIGADEIPLMEVYNKIDRVPELHGSIAPGVANGHDEGDAGPDDGPLDEAFAAETNSRNGKTGGGETGNGAGRPKRAYISALTGAGVPQLRDAVESRLSGRRVRRWIRLQGKDARLRAQLFELGAVNKETIDADGSWRLQVELPVTAIQRLARQDGPEGRVVRDQLLH